MQNFKTKLYGLISLCLLILLAMPAAQADDDDDNGSESAISYEASVLYNSRYIDDGEEELEEGGVYTPEVTMYINDLDIAGLNIQGVYVGAWWAISDAADEESDYTETNLYIGKTWEWDNLEFELSYTYLHFSEDEEGEEDEGENGEEEGEEEEEDEASEDHEFFASVGYEFPWLETELGYVHSTVADGGAIELELSSELELGPVTIEPYAEAMVDFGFVSDEYDGLNHIEVGLEFEVPISETVSLGMYLAHSFAEENLTRDGGEDKTWGGIGLQLEL